MKLSDTPLRMAALAVACVLAHAASHAEEAPREPDPAWVTAVVQAPRLQHRTFESKPAKTKVSYFVYTPEVYDSEMER